MTDDFNAKGVTVDLLEELRRNGIASCVCDHINHRVYRWDGNLITFGWDSNKRNPDWVLVSVAPEVK